MKKNKIVLLLTIATFLFGCMKSKPTQDDANNMVNSAEIGDITKVKDLLEKGVSVNARKIPDSTTALILAAQNGHRQIVEFLLNNGADVNLSVNGTTSLMPASQWGYESIVKKLIEKGAKIDAVDKNGKTALYYASLIGNDDIVKMLVDHGANMEQKTKRSDYFIKGEVTKIDIANNLVVIKSLSGKVVLNDNSKETPFFVKDARYFGISGLSYLKPHDVVTINYSGSIKVNSFNMATASGTASPLSYTINYLAVLSN